MHLANGKTCHQPGSKALGTFAAPQRPSCRQQQVIRNAIRYGKSNFGIIALQQLSEKHLLDYHVQPTC
jgi:hypothetical protein